MIDPHDRQPVSRGAIVGRSNVRDRVDGFEQHPDLVEGRLLYDPATHMLLSPHNNGEARNNTLDTGHELEQYRNIEARVSAWLKTAALSGPIQLGIR